MRILVVITGCPRRFSYFGVIHLQATYLPSLDVLASRAAFDETTFWDFFAFLSVASADVFRRGLRLRSNLPATPLCSIPLSHFSFQFPVYEPPPQSPSDSPATTAPFAQGSRYGSSRILATW